MRFTRLEKFPVVENVPSALTPSVGAMQRIEDIWAQETARRGGSVFNGKIFSVKSENAVGMQGFFTEYRFWQAQRREPALAKELNILRLAVSGIAQCADGFLLGRRGGGVQQGPGLWELIPAGGVDEKVLTAGGQIDLARHLKNELKEETGIGEDRIVSITPFGMVRSDADHVLDVCALVDLRGGASELQEIFVRRPTAEYSAMEIVPKNSLRAFMADHPMDEGAVTILQEMQA